AEDGDSGRRRYVPFILIALFYVIAHSLPTIFAFLESLYWPWIRTLMRFAPSVALGSLEGRIGRIRDAEQKRLQYELLTQAAFRARVPEKGVRYAQLTLEIDHENLVAVDALGSYFLGRAEGLVQQLDIIIKYVNRHLQEKGLLEKFVQQMLQRREFKPEMLPIVKKYLSYFPQNTDLINFAAEVLRSWRATDVGREGMELLEKSFQISQDADLGQILWRVYVACGMRDQAVTLATSLASAGHAVDMIGLLDRLEEDIDQKVLFLQQAIMGMEKARQLEAMQAVHDLHHITTMQAARLIQPLEGFEGEADVNIKFHAQKARDHLKRISLECKTFRDRLRSLQSTPTPISTPEFVPDVSTAETVPTEEPLINFPGLPEQPQDAPLDVVGDSVPGDHSSPEAGQVPETSAADDSFDPFRITAPRSESSEEPGVPGDLPLPALESAPTELESPVADEPNLSPRSVEPDNPPDTPAADVPLEEGLRLPSLNDLASSESQAEDALTPVPPESAPAPAPASVMEQRLFAELQSFDFAEDVTRMPATEQSRLFDDLPTRFAGETSVVENPPTDASPAVKEHLSNSMTQADVPAVAGESATTVHSESGKTPESDSPVSTGVDTVEPSFDASLTDLILGLGENPSEEQLNNLRVLTTVDDLTAWDLYLKQPHEDVTICAVLTMFGGMNLSGVPARLLPFLRHPSSVVRERAVEVLTALGSLDVLPDLALRSSDPLPEARECVARVLAGYDPERILPELKNWLSNADTDKRDLAIRLLKGIRVNESSGMLQTLLYDSEAIIRRNAIRALAVQALPGNARILHEYLDVCTDAEEETLIAKAIDFLENQRSDSPFQE
ncbi:MAG TPA: HEAT repeat domain-containing protein, partial [Candidatus Ozemobacteraceae bacterium]|nr:HEAT repeat domain-containing protein [Candidatus Ozemobacteraceae bacterium]